MGASVPSVPCVPASSWLLVHNYQRISVPPHCQRSRHMRHRWPAPATPNSDARWASHLYPIHLTERYIKTQFRNDQSIRACL